MASSRLVVPESTIPGTQAWTETLISNGRRYASFTEKDVRPLIERYRQLKEHEAWNTWLPDEPKNLERFCIEAFGYSVEFLETMDRGVQVLDEQGYEGPVSKREALEAAPKLRDKSGRPPADNGSNTTISRDRGQTYIVRRLKRDRPDLAVRVIDGELSARAAGIEAGFVPRTQTVRLDDPESAARTLRRHMAPEDLAQLKELL